MNKDIIKGKWSQLKGDIKQKWGNLTDDDLMYIDGSREELSGRIQERYGKGKEEVENEIRDFERSIS